MEYFSDIIGLALSTLRTSAPLILAGLAGLFCERSGIVNIALEGKMLVAAFAAFMVSATLVPIMPSIAAACAGLAAGLVVGGLMALIHGASTITFRGDQVVSGVAINLLAAGMTTFLYRNLIEATNKRNLMEGGSELAAGEFSGYGLEYLFVVLALLAVPLVWWVTWHTRFGMRVSAVGEAPEAADTAGISVVSTRYKAVLISGLLCGIAGASLVLTGAGKFGPDMTANRGYIALAALIFARWRPVATLGSCLLFGFFTALSDRVGSYQFNFDDAGWLYYVEEGLGNFFLALPFILTVVALALFAGRAVAPRAIGTPYIKER
ncbi:MAG: ABC transporter permease [Alphaproteobacteria bacterium]